MYKLYLFVAVGLSVLTAQAQPLNSAVTGQLKARSIGPAVMSGRITAIDAVVSNPDVVYAGAASGGVWKSENGGTSWKPVFDDQSNINIGSIAVQQSNPSVVWVGTGEGNPRNSVNMGNGIYKSIDGGRTWQRMGLEKTLNIHRILIDPTNPNTVYAGVIGYPFGEHPERGVFKTTDGGVTWQRVLFTNEKSGVGEMIMDPSNPQHLIVAMWQHRRTSHDFTSGGPGSGLYVTYDGGKTWAKKTDKHGLPAGDFGRLGLAISRSMPGRVYALVEAQKNGMYRSDDGGETWTKVTEEAGVVTNRPFYFNEIYVDPKNENRVYMIYQPIAVSEDGGKTFKTIATTEQVHADHHALWIHPDNPNLIYNGNDGGVAISRDRGRTWSFAHGIPAGQYYHVSVDNEQPYNVYGGLQDNGSWAGPAYSYTEGGLKNYFWQVVLYGDGFDVQPDPTDARYGYAMSQGGNLARYDRQTGRSVFSKPIAPDLNTKLRFNWNAALALDPHDKAALYYGSQFVHRSTDRGMTWETISPDLTRNDPTQQRQDQSGGLTLDITSAENHNTLLTLAPSLLDKNVVWAGTDDGNVQLTRDGGKTWTNLRDRLPGLPAQAWIPQITASRYKVGEAFVVANNYRNGLDFAPYIYRTADYGQTWTRLLDADDVRGYALCFVQDPAEPRLCWAGTEHGLWVSIDEGQTWTQWKAGMPSVPVMDLVVQEREADLVIGTFGRAIYVLDDLRPLRQLARAGGLGTLDKPVAAFAPADAFLANYRNPVGYMNETDDIYQGQNRPQGAILTYYLKPKASVTSVMPAVASAPTGNRRGNRAAPKPAETPSTNTPTAGVAAGTVTKTTDEGAPAPLADAASSVASTSGTNANRPKADTVMVRVYDDAGKLVRTLRQLPDTTMGMQRITWNLTERGPRTPGTPKPRNPDAESSGGGGFFGGGGASVLPGRYKLVVAYAGGRDSTYVQVQPDPRVPYQAEAVAARKTLLERINKVQAQLTDATDRLADAQTDTDLLLGQYKERTGKDVDALRKSTKTVQDSIKVQRERIIGKRMEKQGYGRPSNLTPLAKLLEARQYVSGRPGMPTATETRLVEQAEQLGRAALEQVNGFFRTQWTPFRQQAEPKPQSVLRELAEGK
ncbi:MAG: hypothetical protein EAZ91_17410 [Cytophagales bacterium]|nr:MAG: hypothetical protein EAZ91_17410 [Cytophagales bacterium]